MNIKLEYDIGQQVHYINYGGYIATKAQVQEGTIQGFQIRKHKGELKIGVDFKQINNLPIELVSTDKQKLEKIVKEYNVKTIEERLEAMQKEYNK